MKNNKPKVLIVDDDVVLPKLIQKSDKMRWADIYIATDGKQALEMIRDITPDVFLLDFLLPDLTGVDLCRAIKKQKALHDIPVVFITSIDETKEIVNAFEAGAVDYVVKPVVMEELAKRVTTHLELYQAQRKLEDFAHNMESIAKERAKQLVHADRLASLGMLSAGLAHEIKNPATFISGNVQTMERFWDVLAQEIPRLIQEGVSRKEELEFILEEVPGVLSGMKDGVGRITKVVDALKMFSRKESLTLMPFNLCKSIDDSLTLCQKMLKNRVRVEKKIPDQDVIVKGDAQQLDQVFVNLIINAADAMERKEDAVIGIEILLEGTKARVVFEDQGAGIPEDQLIQIWNPFFTTKPAGKGTGLGLFICRSIVENHSGTIRVTNRKQGGARFEIVLPLYQGE